MSLKISCYERVKRAIEFKNPDRIPIMHSILPGAWMKYGDKLYNIVKNYPADLVKNDVILSSIQSASCGYTIVENISDKYVFVDDFSYIEPRNFMYGPKSGSGTMQDEWGCLWEKSDPGIVGQVVGHPLQNWDDWQHYKFPDPKALWRWDVTEIKAKIKISRKFNKYIIGYAGNLFEKIQWLRGFENTMFDIGLNPEIIKKLCDRITEYILLTVEELTKFNINGILLSDDWGTQKSLMVSPDIWRKLFKPYYKKIFNFIHDKNCDVHFHTDGNTIEIIPDLIEIGVDVLNPQLSAMDLEELGKIVKGNVCIRTDIDRQYMLVRATSQEMNQYIEKVLKLLGLKSGGIIGCGEIGSDSSLVSVKAMYEAFEKYGRYY